MTKLVSLFFLCLLPGFLPCFAFNGGIASVSISESYFNPTANQNVTLAVSIKRNGLLTVQILDRDGFVVRVLCKSKQAVSGQTSLGWDGKDETGLVVPDEAYSIHATLEENGTSHVYFPANNPAQPFPVKAANYDRNTGVLAYRLDKPSRIHLIAASAKVDPKTQHSEGPMLRIIVNREPRIAGAIVESWNGFDESGTIFVPDQPNFVVSIAATPLPENAIVTWGNKTKKFLDTVSQRSGASLMTYKPKKYEDHQGLSTLQDHSPALRLTPNNATWKDTERHWVASAEKLELEYSITGPSSAEFLKQPCSLRAYINGKKVVETVLTPGKQIVSVPIRELPNGDHIVAINLVSDYGPAAINAFRLKIAEENRASKNN